MKAYLIAVAIGLLFGLVLALVMRSRATERDEGVEEPERGLRARPIPTKEEPAVPPPAKPAPVVKGDGLGSRIRSLFAGTRATAEEWSRLEDLLLRADVGPTGAKLLVERVRERYQDG